MPDGVAVLQPDGSDVRGVVRFDEMFDESGKTVIGVHITYRITGLTDGEHGFHIHQYGDLTDGCTSACEHFDPRAEELETEIAGLDSALNRDLMSQSSREYSIRIRNHRAQILENRHHGSLKSPVRHFGDLGNIKSKGGVSEGGLFLAKACLRDDPSDWRVTKRLHSILGRMIIVHADRDDLGKGGLKKGEIIDEAVHQESLKTGNAGKRLACGVIGLADPDTNTMTMDAEDNTIDDLDDESLMVRMENLAERLDAIVQRIGSYPDAERDPEYLRLVEQHTAYARVLARRHGFGAEDSSPSTAVYIGPGNHLSVADAIDSDHFVLIDSQPRTEYKGGEHEMESWQQHYFMDQLRDMAKALNYELEDFEGGLNDQRASRMTFKTPSGKTIDYYYNSIYPFEDGQEIPKVMESLSTADRLIISGFLPEEQLLNDMPNLDLVYLYENTHYPTEENDYFDDFGKPTVAKGFFERGDESHPSALQFVIMGMDEDYESGNITDQYIEKGPFGGSGITWEYPEAAEQIESNQIGRYYEARKLATGKDWWEAESNDDEVCVNCGTTREERSVQPHRLSRGETKSTYKLGICYNCDRCNDCCWMICDDDSQDESYDIKYDQGFGAESDDEFEYPHHDPAWLYEHHVVQGLSAQKISNMLDVPVNLITRRIHDFGFYVTGEYSPERRMSKNELARMRELKAESDPVSSVAAGTTDAFNDFANSHDTDDKFYFLGGLVGGLALAVLGNIISDRLQDVYFPHWWENRGGSKS